MLCICIVICCIFVSLYIHKAIKHYNNSLKIWIFKFHIELFKHLIEYHVKKEFSFFNRTRKEYCH